MDTTTTLLLGGTTVVLGRWSKGKPADFGAMAALGFVIVIISVFANVSPKVAQPLAYLFLAGVLVFYGPDIFVRFGGKSSAGPAKPGSNWKDWLFGK